MEEKIKIAIVGYGNLGKGVEAAVNASPDMRLTNIFTRRAPKAVAIRTAGVEVLSAKLLEKAEAQFEKPDILVVCGGSANDLPWQSPKYAGHYNIVDSFDNHAKIHEHFQKVDAAAQKGSKLAVIAAGWDPGLFSLSRMLAEALLPCGESYTFWGRGISQGHSDAVRSIEGVLDARQYTIPKEDVLEKIRTGEICNALSDRQCHRRECFVVCEDGGNPKKIRRKILHMPDYFEGYETEVHFISQEELQEKHSKMPHGGTVIRVGKTGGENKAVYDFSLKLDSNPEFTGAVLTAYARAAYRLAAEGESGCRTVFDIPPLLLSPYGQESLIKKFL